MRRFFRTIRLISFALFPATGKAGAQLRADGTGNCSPRDIGDIGRFVDGRGELRVFFPECLPSAAPFILFRLKRQGYSRCTVEVSSGGLVVAGRR